MTDEHASTPPNERGSSIRRAVVTFLVVAAVIAIVVAAALELQGRGTDGITGVGIASSRATAEAESSPAPAFTMQTLDDRTVSLDDFRGDVVVINFWATWCTPCREEAPTFAKLWREYRSRGVRFLGINELDDQAAARVFVSDFELGYPSVFDPAGGLADDFRLYGMPTTVMVDPDATIRYRFVGYVAEPDLRTAIDSLLGEQEN